MKNILNKIIPGLLIVVPVLVAAFIFPGMSRTFDFPKTLLLQFLLLTTALLTLIKFFLEKKLAFPEKFFTHPIAKIILLMLGIIFLATIFSPQRLNAIWGTYERGLGLIAWLTFGTYFFLLLLHLDKKWIERGLKLSVLGTTLIALYGISQKFGLDPIFANFNTDYLEGRIFSTLGNPDFLAQLLAPIIALTVFFAWTKKKPLYVIPTIIMFIALLQTGSRASFLALIFGLAFFVFLLIKKKKQLLMISAALLFVFVLGIKLGLPTLDRFELNSENFRSVESRLVIWGVATQAILNHPILGLGPDNFEIHFPEYMQPDFYYLEDNLHISADRAHNETLEMGLIGGLPLMLLYLALIAWVLHHSIKNPNKKSLSSGISLGLLIIFAQNQLTFSQTAHFTLTFFLLAGLIITTANPQTATWRPTKPFLYFGTTAILLFLLFTFDEVINDRLSAEAWYTYALMTDDTKTGVQSAIYHDPFNTKFRYDLLMWFPETRAEQIEALRVIEGDTIEVIAWKANYMLNVDTEEAYALFEEAIALNPLYPHTTRAYADGLYLNEDFELTAKYYEDYLNLAPEFWTWCPDLESHSEYEQKKYRIFYKNVPDFNNSLIHLYNAYLNLEEDEKAETLNEYLECLQN
jgi:O-antigen ligase